MTRSKPSFADKKRELRIQASQRRAHAALAQETASKAVADLFLSAFAPKGNIVVAGYWPHRTELDCRPLLFRCASAHIPCALPVMDTGALTLRFRRWAPGDPLLAGPFGVSEPDPSSPELRPDLLIVPLLAFDRGGARLGYGGGFYDRTVAEMRREGGVTAVGVAFADQEMATLPHDPHDLRLDWIVTEREAIEVVQS